jgi:hypothetical protein
MGGGWGHCACGPGGLPGKFLSSINVSGAIAVDRLLL